MDVGHLPSPTPINERDSSSEVDMIVGHLPIPHPMRKPHGIALKMFMGYILHFVHISSPAPHKSMVFQIDILTLCKLVAHSILMSSSFCINEHLKKSLSEAQRQTTETQQIA